MTDKELLDLLRRIHHELKEHDDEYHHRTDLDVYVDLNKAITFLDQKEESHD